MAATRRPTILSTGMATVAEIDEAVTTFRKAGGGELVLLHCTSSYPTPPRDVNLRRIPVLARMFGCLAGFSDHTEGTVAAVAAVVLGACFIEKHFTLDRQLPGPDHRFSSDPAEFAALVKAIRATEIHLGDEAVGPTESERVGRIQFRLSCVAVSDLQLGTRLEREHIAFRRPGAGIAPTFRDSLVGLTLMRAVAAGQPLQWADFKHG
jgi:N-acetylneuraminate synthase/N,N'-diacetyllegionaminate synthase